LLTIPAAGQAFREYSSGIFLRNKTPMRYLLLQATLGGVLRTIDFTLQPASVMSAATFAATYSMTYANSTGTRSLQLDANTLKTNVTANQARFDKSSPDAVVELLIEEAKTAPLIDGGFSPRHMMDGWGGPGSGVTITQSFANGPDFGNGGGVNTAVRQQFTAGTAGFSGQNHFAGAPAGMSVWVKSNTGLNQSFFTQWGPGPIVPVFQQLASTVWTRIRQNFDWGGLTNYVPSWNRDTTGTGISVALDLLEDCIQPEAGYVSSFMPVDRTDGDHLTDSLSNWIIGGQLNLEFVFRPQASPAVYTSNPRLLTIKDLGGTVISFVEINTASGVVTVNLNGVVVTGNAAQWAIDDIVDIYVTLGSGTASIGYRRNGGPCTSMIFTGLNGAVVGNSISFFSNFGTQVLAGGYRQMIRYGANSQGPDWYDGGVNPPLFFDFTTQPLGALPAASFSNSYIYFTFSRLSTAGVITGPSTYDLTAVVDEPNFGSYDGVNKGLSLLETRDNTWGVSPHTLTPNGSAATVTPAAGPGNFAAGPDGNITASRVQSVGANQYSGFINASAAPNIASIWVRSNTGVNQSLTKFFDFNGTFSGPYTVTPAYGWFYTGGCQSPHLLMPVVSTGAGMDVVADYAQLENNSNYPTDPITGAVAGIVTRVSSILEYSALNTWVNNSGQLRIEFNLVPVGYSEGPTYSKMRFFDCSSGDYCEIDVATGILTFSIGGFTSSLPTAINWTNRRNVVKIFLEVGGSLPTRAFWKEGTNPAVWTGDATPLGSMVNPGSTAIMSSSARDKNVSGLLQLLRTYPVGVYPSWIPGTPFVTPSTSNTVNIVGVGDSIMAGTSATSFMSFLGQLLGGYGVGKKYSLVNTAFAGQTLALMAASVAGEVQANLVNGKRNVAVLMGGTNDLGSPGATIFGNWMSWQTQVAALVGPLVDAIVMFTITPNGATRTGNVKETNRQAFLTLVDSYVIPANTYVIRNDHSWPLDQNNAAFVGTPQGWTPPDFNLYVNDGNFIHPNNCGNQILAGMLYEQILALPF
jgi:lysophospholipase L1-like esterase